MVDMMVNVPAQYLPDTEHVIRVAVAVALGGLMGLEREFGDKPAGLRTIVLISVGACIFTIVSQMSGGPDWDSTRIAAQIVSGIGFLGAGAILRDKTNVVGLTTAATIWAVAAIGMACGFGDLRLAVLGTGAILVVLFAFDVVEDWIGDRRDIQQYSIVTGKSVETLDRMSAMFVEAGLRIRKRSCHEDGSSLVLQLWAIGPKANHEKLRMALARSEEYQLRRS